MANMFRLLRANEIDARIGIVKPNGVSLLLYKDARCDQNILDETVGPYNWMRSHSRDNANCTVSIWDEKKQQWISKEDTGTESKTEAEKGLASDSFKRACFNWGIGRELYSAPYIWIGGKGEDMKYDKFAVTDIGYDENREINRLQIINAKTGCVVYKYGNVKEVYMPKVEGIPASEPLPPWDAIKAIEAFCKRQRITGDAFKAMRKALIAGGIVPEIPFASLNVDQYTELIKAIEANYPDALGRAS